MFFNVTFFLLLLINLYGLVGAGDVLKQDDNVDNKRSDSGGVWFGPRLGKRTLDSQNDLDDNRPKLREAMEALKFYYDQLQNGEDSQPETIIRRGDKKMIFTPKLGRSINDYIDQYKRHVDHDKRYQGTFTPRLGRRLYEEFPATPQDPSHNNKRYTFTPRVGRTVSEEFLNSISDPDLRGFRHDDKRYQGVLFTPRVGKRDGDDDSRSKHDDKRREIALFTPRVGRASEEMSSNEEPYREEVEQVETRNKYFSPRLGRTNMNFSPRLGRELVYDFYPDTIRVERSVNHNKTSK